MVVTIDKIQRGLAYYFDKEFIPHLTGWSKLGAGTAVALIINNLPQTMERYRHNAFIDMLGVIHDDKQVDITALHDAVCQYFSNEGEYIDLPVIGRVKFTRQDIELLYKYIKEA